VARVTAKLDELGLAENTLVIFTSDNGGAGYIGLPDINSPYRGWKLTHFEGGTHVPFFVRWPAHIAAGSTYAEAVQHIDLMPTIAAAAGATLPDDRIIDGVDVLPYVTGAKQGVPHDTLFWREGYLRTVQHRGWKLISSGRPDKRWLFDLGTDPTEQRNVADAHPQRVAELEALLAAHDAEQAEPLWSSFAESPILIDKTAAEPYAPGDEYTYWQN
ncbi:MAG TPA: sulfatase-like hydrolase/transferase, partial [Pseudomonadales bacterium]|nr:sulfatase-like hydrolase/transferase [Pseudomonadales bacterium]